MKKSSKMILNDDNIKLEIINLRNDGLSLRKIAAITGISKSTLGYFLSKQTHKEWWERFDKKPIASGTIFDHHKDIKNLKEVSKSKRYIITSVQNNTYVHTKFLSSLETMSRHLGAEIIVGTFNYNMSGFQNLQKDDNEQWFDPLIEKYILNEPVYLADDLLWCGELNILPTAVNPLSGFQSYVKSCSGIIPHAKMQLESIPTHKTKSVRMLYTTGAVTKRNYIQKKAGQKANFHHIFGALLVEVDNDGQWYVRQLSADDETGDIQDLTTVYRHDGTIEEGCRVEAITWGDIHIEKIDKDVMLSSFTDEDNILDSLKPKYQFCHDIINFTSKSHHNIKNHHFNFKSYVNNMNSVENEVNLVVDFLKKINRDFCKTVIVESNHDLHFKRWLQEGDYKNDPVNAIFFLESQLVVYKAIRDNIKNFSILEYWIRKKIDNSLNKLIFLKTDESYKILDIECGSHGDLGNNGARGSINSYKILESKYNIGHSHSASIKDGVYQSGHCMDIDKVEYAKGFSSWSHSHIITYPNGKRTIITQKNKGKWKI